MKLSNKEKLDLAIKNNINLYETIFKSNKVEFTKTRELFYSFRKTPHLHSNIITVSKKWQPELNFKKVDENYRKEKWDEWTIKDSFKELKLEDFGFKKLFDAEWLYLKTDNFLLKKKNTNIFYHIIRDEKYLEKWIIAWNNQEREKFGKKTFKKILLKNKDLYFIAGFNKNKKLISGGLVNRKGKTLGISNFFSSKREIEDFSNLTAFIIHSIKCSAIVGYERLEMSKKLRKIGFNAVGQLRVWIKKRKITK